MAGVTKQTASAHLAKLLDARLVAVESQGRHRYFRLADRDVAQLLEILMGVAFRTGAVRLRSSPREPALRKARVCYDHLAGDLGVLAFDEPSARRLLAAARTACCGSRRRAARSARDSASTSTRVRARRPLCRTCLDWSVRRHHLAGALGAALLDRFSAGLGERVGFARARFTPRGEAAFRAALAG